MRLFSIIRFDTRLLIFAKFVEFLKISKVKAGLNVFSFYKHEDMLKICLNFNEPQSTYTYKRYAYKKRLYHELLN